MSLYDSKILLIESILLLSACEAQLEGVTNAPKFPISTHSKLIKDTIRTSAT